IACSNRKALPEIAGDAALFFDPLDIEDMAGAMHRILHDESLREELVAKGFNRSRQFSWDDAAKRTLEVYYSMAGT
ncbi:MAG: glycosyltransferase family 1 protein, partial [Candidatus Hydrogenedentota bacterium]